MTLGELRKILSEYPDDTLVSLEVSDYIHGREVTNYTDEFHVGVDYGTKGNAITVRN